MWHMARPPKTWKPQDRDLLRACFEAIGEALGNVTLTAVQQLEAIRQAQEIGMRLLSETEKFIFITLLADDKVLVNGSEWTRQPEVLRHFIEQSQHSKPVSLDDDFWKGCGREEARDQVKRIRRELRTETGREVIEHFDGPRSGKYRFAQRGVVLVPLH
ncbi:MAG: hypothetical protein HY608_04740 [Planctomycetes bacterium]|nr:hypothetical protein [Planctomycetota bacterium]